MLSHQDTSEQILNVVGRQLGVHTSLTKHGMDTKFIMLLYLRKKGYHNLYFIYVSINVDLDVRSVNNSFTEP